MRATKKKQKKPCPPPKPDCLRPFLSLRFEGVFEESLTVSDSFLQTCLQ